MEPSTHGGEQGEVKSKRQVGPGMYGLADSAKDFGFYSKCDEKSFAPF